MRGRLTLLSLGSVRSPEIGTGEPGTAARVHPRVATRASVDRAHSKTRLAPLGMCAFGRVWQRAARGGPLVLGGAAERV